MIKWVKIGLRGKVLILALVVLPILTVSTVIYTASLTRGIIVTSALQRAETIGHNYAFNAEFGLLLRDAQALDKVTEGVLLDQDVVFASIYDHDHIRISAQAQLLPETALARIQDHLFAAPHNTWFWQYIQLDGVGDVYLLSFPVVSGEMSMASESALFDESDQESASEFGHAVILLSLHRINATVAATQQRLAGVIVVLSAGLFVFIFAMASFYVRNLRRFLTATQMVGRGDLDTRLSIRSQDEMQELGEAFNKMVADLQASTVSIEEMESERQRFNDVVETAEDWIWEVDPAGRLTYANPLVRKILGYEPSEVLGKPLLEFLWDEEAEAVRNQISRSLQTGLPIRNLIGRFRRENGTIIFVEMTGVPVRDRALKLQGYRGVSRDITERRRVEEILLENEERYRTLFEMANDAILIIGNGEITHCNRRASAIFQREVAEIVAHQLEEFSGEAASVEEQTLQTYLQTAAKGESQFFEHTFVRPDETTIETEVSMSGVELHGIDYIQAIVRDVSERKVADRQRLDLEQDLNQVRKLEAMGTLAAGIAHEINTPTQFIGDNVDFLADALDDYAGLVEKYRALLTQAVQEGRTAGLLEEARAAEEEADLEFLKEEVPAAITQTKDGVERVTTIVRAMKEYSHVGNDEREPADINHAIESTTIVCRNEWKYVADLEIDFDPNLPAIPCYLGDVNQVVMNLIVNAAHAIKDVVGDSSELGLIKITTRHEDERAIIEISDTGAGIPEGIRARIFDPFFTTKDVGKGTGQGLSMAHSSIVDKHGGRLTFTSEVGQGTTFRIELPVEVPDAAAGAAA